MAQKRIVVMNGKRLLQESKIPGKWDVVHTEEAGYIKPGLYKLALAKPPQEGKQYTGAIVHTDKLAVYQYSQMGLIKHEAKGFSKMPEIGFFKEIGYTQAGKISVTDVQQKTNFRSRSR